MSENVYEKNHLIRLYKSTADVAPLNLDIYVCKRSEQEKKSDYLKLKKKSTTKNNSRC